MNRIVRPKANANAVPVVRRLLSPALFAAVVVDFEPELEVEVAVEVDFDFDLALVCVEDVDVEFAIAKLESDKGWSQRKNG